MIAGRKDCLAGTGCYPRTLDEIAYCVINHSHATVDEQAEAIRRTRGYLLDVANPERATKLKANELADLTRKSGRTDLLDRICADAGGVFLRLPSAPGGGQSDVMRHAGVSVKEFGEFLASITAAISDGCISREEAERVTREGSQAIAAIAALMHLAEQQAEDRP